MSKSEPDHPIRYPSEREAHVALRDGSTIHVRPVRSDDREAIRAFLDTVSTESIAFRFFGIPRPEWIVDWSLDVDYVDRFALVAETGDPPAIVAHAAYIRESAERAEVAFLVADAWQSRGISTILLAHLAALAEDQGIATLTAEVLPANHRMIQVFRDSGFPVDLRASADAISLELPTSLSPAGLARFEERERFAAVAALRSFLEPGSVAVIGASPTGHGWWRDPAQSAGRRVHRRGLCRQPALRSRAIAAGLSVGDRDSRLDRTGRGRGPGRRRDRGRP